MKIMSYLTGTAIALAVSVGSASAAEQFNTLEGISADVMSSQELSRVAGAGGAVDIDRPGIPPGPGVIPAT